MSVAQCGQTNGNVGIWSRERFTVEPCKGTGWLCNLKKFLASEGFDDGEGFAGSVITCYARWVNLISLWAPGGLGLCAHGPQDHGGGLPLGRGAFHICKANYLHQLLLVRHFIAELKQRMRRKVCPGKAQECPAWLSHLRSSQVPKAQPGPCGCLLPQGLSGPEGITRAECHGVLRTSVRQSPSWLRAQGAGPALGLAPFPLDHRRTLKTLNGHHPAQPSTHSPGKLRLVLRVV